MTMMRLRRDEGMKAGVLMIKRFIELKKVVLLSFLLNHRSKVLTFDRVLTWVRLQVGPLTD